mgnify:CR=1 FL=1
MVGIWLILGESCIGQRIWVISWEDGKGSTGYHFEEGARGLDASLFDFG